ncbi:MAG TPA: hypothetical protein VMG37_24440 [Solirubrobacteraceae bacterium]|nr:hypothetical protein [Solirubrobacteraceae bacterium]
MIGTVGPILVGGFVYGAMADWSAAKSVPDEVDAVPVEVAAAVAELVELELELPHAVTNSPRPTARAKLAQLPHRPDANDRIFLLLFASM